MAASLWQDTYRVGLAVARVLGDSTKTHEIHRVEEITGRPRYRAVLAELAHAGEGRRLLAERPELSTAHVDYDALRALPPRRSAAPTCVTSTATASPPTTRPPRPGTSTIRTWRI